MLHSDIIKIAVKNGWTVSVTASADGSYDAVANKLVRQAFAVVTSNNSYIDGFVSTKPDTTV